MPITKFPTANEDKRVEVASLVITAVGTALLAVFTGLLWRSTSKLWQEAERASEIASQTAKAAKTSADYLMSAERAYIVAALNMPGIKWLNESMFEVRMSVLNQGRTPGTVLAAHLRCDVRENGAASENEAEQPTSNGRRTKGVFLVPQDSMPIARTFQLHQPNLNAVKDGSKTLWVLGQVDYLDTFGIEHRFIAKQRYQPALEGSSAQPNLVLSGLQGDSDEV